MERRTSALQISAACILALGTAHSTLGQITFTGESTGGGTISPYYYSDSLFSKSNGSVDNPTPVTFSDLGSTSVNNVYVRGSSSGSFGVLATFGGLTTVTTLNAGFPLSGPNPLAYTPAYSSSASSQGHASLTVTDLVFEGPTPTVTTSLTFLFSSVLSSVLTPGSSINSRGYTSYAVDLSVSMAGIPGASSTGQILGGRQRTAGLPDDYSTDIPRTGLLQNYTTGTATIQTPSMVVPTGVPLSLTVDLKTTASVNSEFDLTSDLNVNANVGFPGGGVLSGGGSSLFDLPSGFTVHSEAWGVHGNALVGGAVPEPQEYAAVFGMGLVGFAAWRRRNGWDRSH